MRKTKKVKETKVVVKTSDIICNKCGNSCKVGNNDDRWSTKFSRVIPSKDFTQNHYDGILEHEVHGGYYSDLLGDITSYRFSICAACLLEMFKTFKVPVEIKDDGTHGKYVPQNKYEEVVKKNQAEYEKMERKELKKRKKK